MYSLASQLFPICRSITGNGVRDTLKLLQDLIPLKIHEVPTGTPVFDWKVPQEWNIHDAYIKDADGNRVVEFRQSNLHIVNGSQDIQATMCWDELKENLHTLPDQPDWIPYRTCFHQEDWGFCLTHNQYLELESLGNEQYEVCIDATMKDGSLTYGEFFIPGETDEEVLLSSHICHPSLANDNLSGIAVATHLAQFIGTRKRRYGYRFVFAPATIGSITWISQNQDQLSKIKHGLILSLLGDAGNTTYKKTRMGNAEIDRAVQCVLSHTDADYTINEYEPFGYDERQYGSPGINLPVGCFMRTPNAQYPEYHTSADNLDLVQPQYLADSLDKLVQVIELLEGNVYPQNLKPMCEPQLGKHGLYKAFGTEGNDAEFQKAILWVLNLADSKHSLLDIAERSKIAFPVIRNATDALQDAGLISNHNSTNYLCAAETSSPVSICCDAIDPCIDHNDLSTTNSTSG
ncbi:MAG: peptidase M28 [Blastopirellula sp.]|nr:MAG: peptidase M28 [Blastopirellula sp.]